MTSTALQQFKNGRLIPLMDTDLADFPGEEWKDIPGFEGVYQMSNLGRLKSPGRVVKYKNGREVTYRPRIRKLDLKISERRIALGMDLGRRIEGKKQYYSVCKMVYKLFVDATFDVDDHSVNLKRKDKDFLNCDFRNLFLDTAAVANREPENHYQKENKFTLKDSSSGKVTLFPVNRYDKNGNWIRTYASASMAANVLGIGSNEIFRAIRTKGEMVLESYWRFSAPIPDIEV